MDTSGKQYSVYVTNTKPTVTPETFTVTEQKDGVDVDVTYNYNAIDLSGLKAVATGGDATEAGIPKILLLMKLRLASIS